MPNHRVPRYRSACTILSLTLLAGLAATPAVAQDGRSRSQAGPQARQYTLSAGRLTTALNALARQAGLTLSVDPALVSGKTAPAVSGLLTAQQALDRLLSGSGVTGRIDGSTILINASVDARSGVLTLGLVQVSAARQGETAYGPVDGYLAKRSATGMKTDTPIIETPQSISVVTADRIKAIGATRLQDALAYTPGVNTSPWGDQSVYDWLYVRGFDAYSPGFYMDGLQLRNSGTWGVWQTENYGLERIEFLRGPSSVLYGQGAPGGIINVVNKRPTVEPRHEVRAQLGNFNRQQLAADFSGPLDKDGKWLYRATALGQDAEWPTGDLPNDRLFIAPSLTWQPGDDTSLTLQAQFLRLRNGAVWNTYPAAGTLLSNPNGQIPVSTFLGEPDFNRYNQDQWMVGYLLEHYFNDTWSVRQNARYGRFTVDYRTFFEGDFVTVNPGNPADPANFRLVPRTPFTSDEKADSVTVDNQLQAKLRFGRWEHQLLLGLDYQRTRVDVTAHFGGSAPAIDAYAPTYGGTVTVAPPFMDGITTLEQAGLYVQDQIKFADRWVLALGGRYDYATIDTQDRLSDSDSRQYDTYLSKRAGLVYLAPDGWAPYISYTESFFPTTTRDPATGKPFDPETGRQYEAGLRYQPRGGMGRYSVAVFDLRRQNYVSFNQSFIPRANAEVAVRGIELEAIVQPITNWNVTAAYSWTPKADITASADPSEIGNRAVTYAKHIFSLWSDYRFRSGLKLGAGARYWGTTRGFNDAAPAKIPAYVLFDALISYDLGHGLELAVNGRNLADKTYVATCNGSGEICSYGARRKVIATLTQRW